jgi:hypothetical protein
MERAVKPAKSAALETAAVEASTVDPPSSAAVPSAAVRCVGEIWLAEDCRAQQCSCNAHHRADFCQAGLCHCVIRASITPRYTWPRRALKRPSRLS